MSQVLKPYTVKNNEVVAIENYSVVIPNYEGFVYVSHTAEAGSYDPSTRTWTIENFPSGEEYTLSITWEGQVPEACQDNCEEDATASPVNINHGNTLTISGKIPCSSLCDYGTTVLTLGETSANIEVDLEVSSGNYLVTVLDPTLDWYFEYTVECIFCDQKFGPFGPGRVEGSALVGSAKREYSELFTFAGGETEVTVTVTTLPTDTDQVDVYYENGIAIPTVDYTILGDVITFVTITPLVGETLFVKIRKY